MGKLDGVHFARVDFFSNTLQLIGDVDYDRLADRRSKRSAKRFQTATPTPEADRQGQTKRTGVLGFL